MNTLPGDISPHIVLYVTNASETDRTVIPDSVLRAELAALMKKGVPPRWIRYLARDQVTRARRLTSESVWLSSKHHRRRPDRWK